MWKHWNAGERDFLKMEVDWILYHFLITLPKKLPLQISEQIEQWLLVQEGQQNLDCSNQVQVKKKIHIRFHCDSSRSSVVPEFYSKLRAMLLLILLHWLLICSLMSCQVHLSLSMEEKIAGQVSLNWSFSCRTECSPGTALWVFHRSVFKASNKEN